MVSISTLVDRVKIRSLSSGTGPFQLGPAVPAYRGTEALIDGGTYSYSVEQGATYEVGTAVYLASSGVLVRSPQISSRGGAAVPFGANAEINFTALAGDLTAVGGTIPIVDSLGEDPTVAASQKATTDGLGQRALVAITGAPEDASSLGDGWLGLVRDDPNIKQMGQDLETGIMRSNRVSLGTAGEYRTLTKRTDDRFDIRDMLGCDLAGNNDMASLLSAAASNAQASGDVLHIPNGTLALGSPVTVLSGTRIKGVGNVPYTTLADGGSRGPGTWFHLAHSGQGFVINGFGFPTDIIFESIGTFRDQPSPAAGWTPNPHDFDFVNQGGRLVMRDCCLLNPTKGIVQTTGPAGQLFLDHVIGQPFDVGLQIDSSYEGCITRNLRWWVYWSNDEFTRSYTLANRKGIYSRHCDNPDHTGYFNIFSRYPVCFGSHPNGVTNSASFTNPEFDLFGGSAVFYETGANGAYAKFIGGYSYGNGNTNAACESLANNSKSHFIGHKFASLQNRAVLLDSGQNNVAVIEAPEVRGWNIANGNFEAFAALGTGNKIFLNGPVITEGGNGAPLVNTNLAGIVSDEWVFISGLAVTAQSGGPPTATASGRFQRRARTITATITVQITANNGSIGDLRVALPVAGKTGQNYYGSGTNQATGDQLQIVANGSFVTIKTYNNLYPVATGQTIEFSIVYECDPL